MNSLNQTQNLMNYGLSCDIMITSENKEVISCFYQLSYPLEIGVASFEFDETNITYIKNLRAYSLNDGSTIIKSATSEDKKQSLICFVKGYQESSCLNYNIDQNKFSAQTRYFNACKGTAVGVNVYYFKEKNEYMFICNDNSKGFKMVTFNENFEDNVVGVNNLTHVNYAYGGICYGINTFSVIYIQGMDDYAMINDCKGNDNIITSGITRISNLLGGVNNLPDEIGIINDVGEETTNESTEEKQTNANTNMNNSEEISTTYQSTIPFEPTTIITNIPTTLPEVKETTVITEVTETTIITEVKETTIITEEKEPTIITEEISNSYKSEEKPILYIVQETTSKKREEILNDLNNLIKDKESKQTYIIEGSDFTVIIKPINKYVEDSTDNIDFS